MISRSSLDPHTPVLVGVGAAGQRCDDPTDAADVVTLMTRAARSAGADAGAPGLLVDLRWVAATKGNARLDDPARLVAQQVGSPDAHTVLSDIGVLQTAPLREAARLIAAGQLDAALEHDYALLLPVLPVVVDGVTVRVRRHFQDLYTEAAEAEAVAEQLERSTEGGLELILALDSYVGHRFSVPAPRTLVGLGP